MKAVNAFRPRMRLALKAAEDYEAQRFHACIPVVLALADGMVNEISEARRGFFAEETDLSAWDSIAAHERGLNALKNIFMKGRRSTTTEPLTIPYRNGIFHGMDLGYDNAMVAAKTWAALFALRDWASRAERSDLQAPPPERGPKLRDILQQSKRLDEMKRELGEWTPRQTDVGVHIPPKGPLSAYREGTAEHCLFQFLSLWQRRNYGHMVNALQAAGGKPIPPAEVRAQFEFRVLKDFEFVSVKDIAAAISEITVKRAIEHFGQSREEEVVYRMCRVDASGRPALASEPTGRWTIVMWIV